MDSKNPSKELVSQGYTVLQGSNTINASWGELLEQHKAEWGEFSQSWNNLPPDNFLSDGGHYRFRRYSVFNFSMAESELQLLPHEPHFQSTYRNNMNGGINRDYEAFDTATIKSPLLTSMINYVTSQISFKFEKQWRIQAHQFRIQASAGEAGQPTPEGIHRDGADFILIMVLNRKNMRGGVNHIYDDAKRLVFGGILENAGDAVLIDDRKVWHGVSEVYPVDDSKPAHRDVLVLTFHHEMML
ncbi:MAG: 2OG-Fe dioxygenase family protein [Cocleimonas sp.]|nr:2OG-Fe dioxygenase family protein [Cocleimonas sp.]